MPSPHGPGRWSRIQLLEEHVPDDLREQICWRHVAGDRSPEGSQRTRPERVEQVVQEVVDEEGVALLGRFDEERAPGGIGVEGVPQALQALARGEVAALLLVPGALAGRSAWFGPRPAQVAAEADDGTRLEWGPTVRAPLVDVAVRAALGAGGQVWLVPDGLPGSPAEGIGTFCRFRRAAPASASQPSQPLCWRLRERWATNQSRAR